jgi:hypothetical protein
MNTSPIASTCKTVWSEGYRPTKADTAKLYEYTFATAGGLVIECYLEYEKAERQTRDHPGRPESCELIWATVGGIDIYEVITELQEVIECEALEKMAEDANDALADAAADAYEDRMCDDRWKA